jgi:hypothetical protein
MTEFKDFISAREYRDRTIKQATVNPFQIIPHSPFITTFPPTVPKLSKLVAGSSQRRPGFNRGPMYVGFVVDGPELGQVLLQVLRLYTESIIPPVLHTHPFVYHRRCIFSATGSVVK